MRFSFSSTLFLIVTIAAYSGVSIVTLGMDLKASRDVQEQGISARITVMFHHPVSWYSWATTIDQLRHFHF